MSAAVFEKHDYRRKQQQKASLIEGFDPWPVKCRSIATSIPSLPDVCGESLSVSVLFDTLFCTMKLYQHSRNCGSFQSKPEIAY